MTERLPDSVAQIAEVIGVDAALQLVRQWPRGRMASTPRGRVAIYVPATMPADHPIAAIIGHAAALELARRFGGEILQPSACSARVLRDSVVLASREGAPSDMIARVLGVTPQHVRRIRKANISAMGGVCTGRHDSRMTATANHA